MAQPRRRMQQEDILATEMEAKRRMRASSQAQRLAADPPADPRGNTTRGLSATAYGGAGALGQAVHGREDLQGLEQARVQSGASPEEFQAGMAALSAARAQAAAGGPQAGREWDNQIRHVQQTSQAQHAPMTQQQPQVDAQKAFEARINELAQHRQSGAPAAPNAPRWRDNVIGGSEGGAGAGLLAQLGLKKRRQAVS